MRRRKMGIKILFLIFLTVVLVNKKELFQSNNPKSIIVYAEKNDIKYTYDNLGRVKTETYTDGTVIIYTYDKNGNITKSAKNKKTTTESEETNHSKTENTTQQKTTETNNKKPVVVTPHYTATNIKNYNKFKNRKVVIKSLKKSKSKKKYYLQITVKQVMKRGTYGEIGYQIKYATNSKYKKAKTIKFNRVKKGSLSKKKWKVKKGKTYYVKVRAYMKTVTGKTIYTKYSKTKKLKVK